MMKPVIGHILNTHTYCLRHSPITFDQACNGNAKDHLVYQSNELCSVCDRHLTAIPFESTTLVYRQDRKSLLGRTWTASHPALKRVCVTIEHDFGGWWCASVTANPYQRRQETWLVRLDENLNNLVSAVDDFISSTLFEKVSSLEGWSVGDGKHMLKE